MTISPLVAFAVFTPQAAAPPVTSGRREPDQGLPGAASPSSASRPSSSETSPPAEQGKAPEDPVAAEQAERASSPDGLTAKERRIVAELQRIDRQVRAHEQAHLAVAGGLARGVSFRFATGPDGRRYAVGGEVRIDAAPVKGDPQATIRKAQQVRAAANAPANPSPQDRAMAAQASAMETQARQELFAERRQALQQQIRSSQAKSFGHGGVEPGVIFSTIG
jgi:hypothetical protein